MKDYPDKMTAEQARMFRDDVLTIVSQIPRGRVTTYGHIAVWAGWPSHSRMVGRTLRYTPGAEHLPCHLNLTKGLVLVRYVYFLEISMFSFVFVFIS